MDGKMLFYVGSALASALTAVYVIWGSAPSSQKGRRKTKTDMCPGLENTGNTCYLNATLQGLASCICFVDWLLFHLKMCEDRKSKYITSILYRLLKVLNNEGDEVTSRLCPAEVIHTLRSQGWHISSEEQDAHELFHVLTQSICEEEVKFQEVVSLFDTHHLLNEQKGMYQTEKTAVNKYGALPLIPARILKHPFQGQLARQLQCTVCKTKKPVRYGQFDSLTLTIPDTHWQSQLTLDRLLQHFLSHDVLDSVDCEECRNRKINIKPAMVMTTTIGKLPSCLCIHIQRSVVLNSGMLTKRDDHVVFPEFIDMSKYVHNNGKQNRMCDVPGARGGSLELPKRSQDQSFVNTELIKPAGMSVDYRYLFGMNTVRSNVTRRPISSQQRQQLLQQTQSPSQTSVSSKAKRCHLYRLVSVLSHIGGVESGHFITYRRSPSSKTHESSGNWIYTSDLFVRRVTLQEVLATNAYMLFYEKV